MQQSQNKKAHLYSNKNFLEYALRSKSNSRAHLHTIKNIVFVLKKCVKNRSAILKIRYTHLKKSKKKKENSKTEKIVAEIN